MQEIILIACLPLPINVDFNHTKQNLNQFHDQLEMLHIFDMQVNQSKSYSPEPYVPRYPSVCLRKYMHFINTLSVKYILQPDIQLLLLQTSNSEK